MPKQVIPLTAVKVKTVKPTEKEQNLFDGGGLYLHVRSIKYGRDGKLLPGSKLWRLKYRYGGKARKLSLGSYPAVSLEEARQKRQEVKELIAKGIDPQEMRRQAKAEKVVDPQGEMFGKIAMDWYRIAETGWSKNHARTVLSRIERDVLPALGHKLIAEITTRDVLDTLRRVEDRQAYETAHRIRTIIGQIFSFALISGVDRVLNNPASGLSKALRKPETKHMAAILDPDKLGQLLRDIDAYAGVYITKCALRLTPMLFVRPGELRTAEWQNVDLDGARWRIPAARMKLKRDHVVPLARQAVEILRDLHMYTGDGKYVFPGRTASRVMSGNTVNSALRTMGWSGETVTAHGFRATARTLLHEKLGFNPDAIEAQLAHDVPDRLGSAYNRTKHLDERIRMMQEWADFLDGLKSSK